MSFFNTKKLPSELSCYVLQESNIIFTKSLLITFHVLKGFSYPIKQINNRVLFELRGIKCLKTITVLVYFDENI